jgi:hypothetical protein
MADAVHRDDLQRGQPVEQRLVHRHHPAADDRAGRGQGVVAMKLETLGKRQFQRGRNGRGQEEVVRHARQSSAICGESPPHEASATGRAARPVTPWLSLSATGCYVRAMFAVSAFSSAARQPRRTAARARVVTDQDRLLSASRRPEDVDAALRPKSLDEFVGQQAARDNLRVFIQAAKGRGDALDHVLFFGPPGLGKTTLAQIIAREMGVGFRATSGPVIAKSGDLAALLTNLEDGDVLFIDEIHRLQPAVEEVLYPRWRTASST